MLLSLAFIFLLGLLLSWGCEKLQLPALLGMLICGIILGPYGLNLLSQNLLFISADLRKIALIIILLRAGLSLDLEDLKQAGRPALFMCFLPACFEIAAVGLFAPILFGISLTEALLLGSVLAAVSPAVIVPKMIHLLETQQGTDKHIPQIIMAGASIDDIFVIVLFTSFLSLVQGQSIHIGTLLNIPMAIISGGVVGFIFAKIFRKIFQNFHLRDSVKVLLILSVCFIFVALEDGLNGTFSFSGLLAVMCMGMGLKKDLPIVAQRISLKFSKLWVGAQLLLFALVGACVELSAAFRFGLPALLLLFLAILIRMAGVFLCLVKTNLTIKERLFCMIAYTPKATVQAAIGAVPLSLGLSCGNLVLTIAVISILVTAPLGAFGIDFTAKRFLHKN